jgi:hypothetical protein
MKARLQKSFPKLQGMYQIVVTPVHIEGNNYVTSFYMIVADINNIAMLRRMFLQSESLNGHKFYPWDQFLSCKKAQQIDLIQRQQQYYATYQSTIIHGFTDENPPMLSTAAIGGNTTFDSIINCSFETKNQYDVLADDDEDTDEIFDEKDDEIKSDGLNNEITEMDNNNNEIPDYGPKLNDFIKQYFINCYDDYIFEEVYEPINGCIELIFKNNIIMRLTPYFR